MAGPTVGIRFQGDDYVSPTVKGIKQSVDGLGASAKTSILTGFGMGAGIAAFGLVKSAVGALIGPFGDAWQLSKDTQAAQVLLGQALKNNIPNWNGNVAGADSFAKAQGRLGFESNDVRASLGQLVGITHDLAKAQELIALAEDLARSKGIDLASATDIVTKAALGNGKALKALGIDTRGATTAAELLSAVQKNVTQTAEEWAKTSSGKAAVAQVKLTEGMTKLGKVIDNVAQVVIPAVADAVSFLIDHFNDLVPALSAVAITITVLMIPALVSMAATAWAAVAPLLPLIAALTALGIVTTRQSDVAKKMTNDFGSMIDIWGLFGHDVVAAVDQGFSELPVITERGVEASRQALADGKGKIVDASHFAFTVPITDAMNEANHKAYDLAHALPGDIAKALRDGSAAVDDAGKQLAFDMTHEIDNTVRLAYLKSLLVGDQMAAGLADSRPVVRAQAKEWQRDILAEIATIEGGAQDIAVNTGQTMAAVMNAQAGVLATAAVQWKAAILHNLPTTGDMYSGAVGIGNAWVAGLAASIANGVGTVRQKVQLYYGLLHGTSPPKEGPLKNIDKGGYNVGKAWAIGFGKGIGTANLNLGMPSLSGGGSGMQLLGGGGGGGSPIVIQLEVDGRTLAEIVTRQQYYMAPTTGPLGKG